MFMKRESSGAGAVTFFWPLHSPGQRCPSLRKYSVRRSKIGPDILKNLARTRPDLHRCNGFTVQNWRAFELFGWGHYVTVCCYGGLRYKKVKPLF